MKVQELLATPETWTKRSYARDKNGVEINVFSDEATCFCLMGAVNRCYGDPAIHNEVVKQLHASIARKSGCRYSVVAFNDSSRTTHEDVLAVLKDANI